MARDAAVGRPLATLFDRPFTGRLARERRDHAAGSTLYRVPLTSRHAGEPRELLVNAAQAPLLTPGGDTAGTMILLEDITARVRLEEQLQLSERMASVGLLAAGVAHEVNTPLTGISSFTQMLIEGAAPGDSRLPLLKKIERQVVRAARIVNGLLNLSRPGQSDAAGAVDVNGVMNDVLVLVEHQLRTSNIRVRRELSPTPTMVQGVEGKLQQVFLNLILNARDAMPTGGLVVRQLAERRRPGGDRGRRHRHRDSERGPGPHLRPVLHDQGGRSGPPGSACRSSTAWSRSIAGRSTAGRGPEAPASTVTLPVPAHLRTRSAG